MAPTGHAAEAVTVSGLDLGLVIGLLGSMVTVTWRFALVSADNEALRHRVADLEAWRTRTQSIIPRLDERSRRSGGDFG